MVAEAIIVGNLRLQLCTQLRTGPAGESEKRPRLGRDDAPIGIRRGSVSERQISDDLRAIWRPRGPGDLANLGRTLPVVYARGGAPVETRNQLQGLVTRAPDDEAALTELQTLLTDPATVGERSQGVLHYVTVQAGIHHRLAREALLATARWDVAHDALLKLLDRVLPAVADL